MCKKVFQNIGLSAYLFMVMTGHAQSLHPDRLLSSVLLKGNAVTAYRDPMVFVNDGMIYLYFTLTEIVKDGKVNMSVAMCKSPDLKKWSVVKKITVTDQSLDYSSPGNIIRYGNQWVMCLQTYPRPGYTVDQMPKYGNQDARLFTMHSDDLEKWSAPEMLYVKGDTVSEKEMGRMIDPFILEDQHENGKWWIFYKQKGASRSYSYDLKHWTYDGHMAAGENICIVPQNGAYIMFHSPNNGIGIKRSKDLATWVDDVRLITLGQHQWDWAKGRITAGFLVDMNQTPTAKTDYRYLLFFHGSGPATELAGDFDKNASIGVTWSNDLVNWRWK